MLAVRLFTLIASSPSFGLPRFGWLSMVIEAIVGGAGGVGGCGGLGCAFALLDLEAIL